MNKIIVLIGVSTCSYVAGADPGFSERGVRNLKKRVWSASPEAIGICIVKHQNYTLCMSICLRKFLSSNQVSIAS